MTIIDTVEMTCMVLTWTAQLVLPDRQWFYPVQQYTLGGAQWAC